MDVQYPGHGRGGVSDRIEELITQWESDPRVGPNITAHTILMPRNAVHKPWPAWVPDSIRGAWEARGVERPYSHQAEAMEQIRRGRDTVLVTPTASGKTLAYNVPVLTAIREDPETRALYIFPTKALAQDQYHELHALSQASQVPVRTHTYDGDTAGEIRQAVRETGHVVMTNPDMLHSGILPHHPRWLKLFTNLKYVVIDEVHTYRGVFGSHMANVLRRLRRVALATGHQQGRSHGSPGHAAQSGGRQGHTDGAEPGKLGQREGAGLAGGVGQPSEGDAAQQQQVGRGGQRHGEQQPDTRQVTAPARHPPRPQGRGAEPQGQGQGEETQEHPAHRDPALHGPHQRPGVGVAGLGVGLVVHGVGDPGQGALAAQHQGKLQQRHVGVHRTQPLTFHQIAAFDRGDGADAVVHLDQSLFFEGFGVQAEPDHRREGQQQQTAGDASGWSTQGPGQHRQSGEPGQGQHSGPVHRRAAGGVQRGEAGG